MDPGRVLEYTQAVSPETDVSRRVLVFDAGLPFDRAVARTIAQSIRDAEGRGPDRRVAFALSGGRTSVGVFQALAAEPLPWHRVELFWCDERAVPPGHADSNYGLFARELLSRVKILPERVHRMEGELPAEDAAARYDALLGELAPRGLDLAVLGIGTDGHTCSLFPGSPALESKARAAASVAPDERPRITLTLSYLALAPRHLIAVGGKEKSAVVRKALAGDRALPISRVRPAAETIWVLDAASASA